MAQSMIALPYRATKVVHLIRHGKGYHNDLPEQSMYTSWDYYDAHLTPFMHRPTQRVGPGTCSSRAHQQLKFAVLAFGNHLGRGYVANGKEPVTRVELIVASPLTRTLETAAGAFGVPLGTDILPSNSSYSDSVLMTEIASLPAPSGRTQHALLLKPAVPILAHEGCRETLGVHPCDKRRSITEIRAQFPGVNFGLIEHDEDVFWKTGERERADEIQARGLQFAAWLMARPEKHIAVVSHSGFLYAFFQNFGAGYAPRVASHLHRHFNNCEMRTILLSDVSGDTSHAHLSQDPLAFLGGGTVPDPELEKAPALML